MLPSSSQMSESHKSSSLSGLVARIDGIERANPLLDRGSSVSSFTQTEPSQLSCTTAVSDRTAHFGMTIVGLLSSLFYIIIQK